MEVRQDMTANYVDYEKSVRQSFWDWADRHHRGELDGERRENGPPVLAVEHVLENVLVPEDMARTRRIRETASQIP